MRVLVVNIHYNFEQSETYEKEIYTLFGFTLRPDNACERARLG